MFSTDSGFSGQQGSETSPASQMSQNNNVEFTGFMHGDFYSELDDTVRSVVLAPGEGAFGAPRTGFFFDDSDFLHGSKGFGSFDLKSTGQESTSSKDLRFPSKLGVVHSSPAEFQPSDVAPLPPASQHFQLSPTTLLIESISPHEIGNAVLAFLESQMTALISDLQTATYSISAEVFIQGVCCTLDVNIYEVPDSRKSGVPSLFVEFNRSSGDAFTFGTAFRLAADFLAVRCLVREGLPEKPSHLDAPRFVPYSEPAELGFEEVAPLLEMAGTMALQAEAAAALYKLASGGLLAASPLINNPEAAGAALTQLLASDRHDAAYPAACSLVALADCGRAGPLLASPGLLQALARYAGAQMEAAPSVICDAFAQAVATAVHVCAEQLSSAAAAELRHVLEQTVNYSVPDANAVAHKHLQEALFELKAVA